ncbi:MAG: hypothetical protein ACREOP_09995 [Thermodesulfobacteriota bacterium]
MDRTIKVEMDLRGLSEKVKEHYNLPPDAIYRGHEYDAARGRVMFTFEHTTFDLVKEPPVMDTVPPPNDKAESGGFSIEDPGPEGSEDFGKAKKKNG